MAEFDFDEARRKYIKNMPQRSKSIPPSFESERAFSETEGQNSRRKHNFK